MHPELGARLVAAESEERRRAEDDPLSERESEVLRLLALGHTNQEIAKQLFISVRTAETHRAHIMQKLGLSSRAELVRYALERGLLETIRSPGGLASDASPSPVVHRLSDRRRARPSERPPGAERSRGFTGSLSELADDLALHVGPREHEDHGCRGRGRRRGSSTRAPGLNGEPVR